MPTFDSDGVSIYYEVHGTGQPILLVHGFASSFERNWKGPGWVDFLTAHGFQVIGLDVRGHGASGKPYDPQAHSAEHTAADVLNLLDHLHLAKPDLMAQPEGNHPDRQGEEQERGERADDRGSDEGHALASREPDRLL